MTDSINVNIKLSLAPNELGSFVKHTAENDLCSYSSAVRKMIKNAKEEADKKQLKNMPMFKK